MLGVSRYCDRESSKDSSAIVSYLCQNNKFTNCSVERMISCWIPALLVSAQKKIPCLIFMLRWHFGCLRLRGNGRIQRGLQNIPGNSLTKEQLQSLLSADYVHVYRYIEILKNLAKFLTYYPFILFLSISFTCVWVFIARCHYFCYIYS